MKKRLKVLKICLKKSNNPLKYNINFFFILYIISKILLYNEVNIYSKRIDCANDKKQEMYNNLYIWDKITI